jgi:hypothetical protein
LNQTEKRERDIKTLEITTWNVDIVIEQTMMVQDIHIIKNMIAQEYEAQDKLWVVLYVAVVLNQG